MLAEPYKRFSRDLLVFIPQLRVIDDPLRTLVYGTDASFYRLIPKLVVKVESEVEVSRVLQLARQHGVSVTFRAAGTSVSGQAVTESVLVLLGTQWQGCEISADASEIRLQPGVIGSRANQHLAPFHKKIGPDPASINAAKIGGIAANNASGMCCVLAQNSYHTLVSARIILADGSLLDTGDDTSRRAFSDSHHELLDRLDRLARKTRTNAALADRIRHKFKIRNTCGYSLNALVDFEDPIDILQHLMIGSEGTLGFIAAISYRTVDDPPHKATALILFPEIKVACEAATLLRGAPVVAVELMDRASLRSVQDQPGMPGTLRRLAHDAAALLIETRAHDETVLRQNIEVIERSIGAVRTLFPVHFTDHPEEYTRLWNIRKGLYPSVGAMREPGTAVIVEDIVFPLERLAAATMDLHDMLRKHGYDRAIILGHAMEGNLHFIFTEDFSRPEEVARYRGFMQEFVELVVHKYDGSLKGEHGTGRNMAPFVELEWGREAYALMREIKSILDPDNILNPGVILNEDREVHVKNLKPLFPVHPEVDKCIECGFCELICPSRELSLTPRHRIVGLREIARLEASGEDAPRLRALHNLYQYSGMDTCAGDGLCALTCPVGIDTGRMMRIMRGSAAGGGRRRRLVDRFALPTGAVRFTFGVADAAHAVLGTSLMQRLASGARKLSGNRIPQWNPYMPTVARIPVAVASGLSGGPRLVYFPSCVSRTMGPARGDPQRDALPVTTAVLLQRAGYEVVFPRHVKRLCCGLGFESKGLFAQANAKAEELGAALRAASREGQDPVISDTSPCTLRMRQALGDDVRLRDITEFIHDDLLQRMTCERLPETVAVHATCSARTMNLEAKLRGIAEACAEEVIVPGDIGCCGWAGDKGFTHPELTASALCGLRASLPDDCVAGYSTSRTCEIGLSLHSGRHYRSIVYLVERCARPQR